MKYKRNKANNGIFDKQNPHLNITIYPALDIVYLFPWMICCIAQASRKHIMTELVVIFQGQTLNKQSIIYISSY